MLICWKWPGIHKVQLCFSLPSVCGRGRKSKASSIDQIRSLKTPCKGAPSRSGGCQTPSNPWRLKRSPEVLPTQPHYWKGSGPRLIDLYKKLMLKFSEVCASNFWAVVFGLWKDGRWWNIPTHEILSLWFLPYQSVFRQSKPLSECLIIMRCVVSVIFWKALSENHTERTTKTQWTKKQCEKTTRHHTMFSRLRVDNSYLPPHLGCQWQMKV